MERGSHSSRRTPPAPKRRRSQDRQGAPLIRGSASGIRLMLRLRNTRASIFGATDLFQDPAWDILLDLYAAHLEGRSVSVSSACIASMVPPTTALRWITVLEKRGLVLRANDDLDARRRHLFLTDKARRFLETFIEAVDTSLNEMLSGTREH